MNRVVITGATGFIGRQCLAPLRERGFEVHAVARTPGTDPGVTWHACDLFDAAARAAVFAAVRPTHVLHLAWYAVPGAYWTSEENVRWVEASLALAREARAAGCRRLVVAGTCAEYEWTHGTCIEGTTPLVPTTLYGASKHALHGALAAWARQFDVSCAWGRLFFLYGPHEAPARLVASVIRDGLAHRATACSPGTQIRDFQHVADAAGAFVALLASEVTGAVNIASGHAISVADLVTRIADRLSTRELVKLGAKPMPPNEPARLAASVARLHDEVGWRDRFTLDAGLADTIDSWRVVA